MARQTLVTEEPIELVIDEYFDTKSKADKYKKSADEMNKRIKAMMTADDAFLITDSPKRNNRTYVTSRCVADYYEKEVKSMNEDALLEFLKEKGYKKAIKKVEVVDMDALENLIYNGKISEEDQKEMLKFEEVKITPTLTVKARKE